MSITTTFDPPAPSDSPSVFNAKAFTLLGDLNDWSEEANALASSANAAQTAATSAATSAGTSASTATTKASEAASSASAAATSASAASTSAASAEFMADSVANSSYNAAQSESNAAYSATNAASSATAAAASASGAAAAAAAAVSGKANLSGAAFTGDVSAPAITATAGNINLQNAYFLTGRNAANTAYVPIVRVTSGDVLDFGAGGYASQFNGPVSSTGDASVLASGGGGYKYIRFSVDSDQNSAGVAKIGKNYDSPFYLDIHGSTGTSGSGNEAAIRFLRNLTDENGRFDASGNLLVGTASNPSNFRAVFQSAGTTNGFKWRDTAASSGAVGFSSEFTQAAGTGFAHFSAVAAGAEVFHVLGNGNVQNTNNSYGAISDPKLKTNISLAKSQWEDVKQLARNVVKYNFKSDPKGFKQIGFLSRDAEGITGVRSISPGLVLATPDMEDYEIEPARTEVRVTKKQKVEYSEGVRYEILEVEGKYTKLPIRTTVETPVFEVFPLFDEEGEPVMEVVEPAIEAVVAQDAVLDAEGNVATPAIEAVEAKPAVMRQIMHQVPVMEEVSETVEVPAVIGRRETGESTDSVQYSVASMKAFKALGEALERIEALEDREVARDAVIDSLMQRVAALEARGNA